MSATLFIAGDFCPIGRHGHSTGILEFKKVFGDLGQYISTADFSIVNLECPLTESNSAIKKTGPNIKASTNAISYLSEIGVNLVTLSNNHIMDFGEQGLQDTLNACNNKSINTVGAGINIDEARKPWCFQLGDHRFAVLNFSENEFCAAEKNKAGANPVNLIQNFHDIKDAKKVVDYTIIIGHGGREHYSLPTPTQRERYRFYIDCGADIVVGHHPHCYSGFEKYNNGLIFYSLGNFLFDYKKKYQKGAWTKGLGLKLEFENNEIKYELIPFHQGRKSNPNIVLFDEAENRIFLDDIKSLNLAIQDDKEFFKRWSSYLSTQKAYYRGMLFKKNKYIRYITSMPWVPKIRTYPKEYELLMLNLLRCETHREIATSILEQSI